MFSDTHLGHACGRRVLWLWSHARAKPQALPVPAYGSGLSKQPSGTATGYVRRGSGDPSGMKGLDVEKLLQQSEGVGNPGFAFDVKAFRGVLHGIAEKQGECS